MYGYNLVFYPLLTLTYNYANSTLHICILVGDIYLYTIDFN